MAKTWALDDRHQLQKAANEELDRNLAQGERVRVIIRGVRDSAMIATDRRLFVFKKGFMSGATFGKKIASWDYRNLSGVQIETGVVSGVLALQGAGIASGDTSYWKSGKDDPWKAPYALALSREHFDQARQGIAGLRELIALAQASVASASVTAATDITDQLRKLGELRDAGVLTEAEFSSKKTELLARM
jgi:hypothetical protein